MRNGKTLLHRFCASLAVAVLIVGTAGAAWAAVGGGTDIVHSADIIRIDAVAGFRKLENLKVVFRHDLHTRALAVQGKDCSACHMTAKDGKMSTKFMRLEDKSADSLKLVYHTNCVSCHTAAKKEAKAGQKSGPLEDECKRCHFAGRYIPARQSFSYGATMHDKHVRSPLVKAEDSARNCTVCHHKAAPGKEDSCRVCHVQGHGIRPWYSEVGHDFCIACHKNVSNQAKNAPLECAGCHSAEAKAAQAVIKDVPRLMRGQPDTLLIFPVSKDSATPDAAMKPSLFDHKAHEAKTGSCRSCHHVRIGSCVSCHTAEGTQAGYNVNLDRAMHDEKSPRSCVGCHNKRLQAPECAGCHGFVKHKRGKDFCNVCHVEVPGMDAETFAAGIAGTLPKEVADRLTKAATTARKPAGAANLDNIPEVVSIGALKNEYAACEFNHKAHLDTYIMSMVEGDKLASAFHTDKATLCVGCHHNSPPSESPPKCASCHGKTVHARFPERTALKDSYHLLCMGCHDRMKVEPVAKTDCTACHAQAKK